MSATAAAVPFWPAAGMTYIGYSNICAALVRNCLEEPFKSGGRVPREGPLFRRQAAAIRIEIKGGQWRDAYMQMNGEPWKQPLSSEYSTFVDIKKVSYPSLIIYGGNR